MSENRSLVYQIGRYRLVPRLHRLFLDEKQIHLREKTFRVLTFLVEHRHRALSKEEILNEIWNCEVTEGVLPNCIKELRDILGLGSIDTISGYGYQFDEK